MLQQWNSHWCHTPYKARSSQNWPKIPRTTTSTRFSQLFVCVLDVLCDRRLKHIFNTVCFHNKYYLRMLISEVSFYTRLPWCSSTATRVVNLWRRNKWRLTTSSSVANAKCFHVWTVGKNSGRYPDIGAIRYKTHNTSTKPCQCQWCVSHITSGWVVRH